MLIVLEGLKFHAFHGNYPEEQLTGNEFEVDVYITSRLDSKEIGDKLDRTIDYEEVYRLIKKEIGIPSLLLESVVERIMGVLSKRYQAHIGKIKIRLSKLNPPFGGEAKRVYIEVEREFSENFLTGYGI